MRRRGHPPIDPGDRPGLQEADREGVVANPEPKGAQQDEHVYVAVVARGHTATRRICTGTKAIANRNNRPQVVS